MSINLILLSAIFLIHIYILVNEIKNRKIYNRYLLLLIMTSLIYIGVNINSLYAIPLLIKTSILIAGTYILYRLKIWSASILKYIFASSLVFLGSLEFSFISNIFFVIFLYIVSYFLYYYGKVILSPKRLQAFISTHYLKAKGETQNWLTKNKGYIGVKIFLFILGFFSVFILIRLIRIYLQGELHFLWKTIELYNININIFVLIIVFLFIITMGLHLIYQKYLARNFKYLTIIIICTTVFLTYEFLYDYEFISENLHRILTFLLAIFIAVGIIMRMGKYLFFDADSKIIDYQLLKPGDIIDKKLISSYLIGQKSLEEDNIGDFIKNIKNPINQEDVIAIKKYIKKNSDYQEKEGKPLPPNVVKIYNTFLFTPFIFISFLLTIFTEQNLLVSAIIVVFKKIMGLEIYF